MDVSQPRFVARSFANYIKLRLKETIVLKTKSQMKSKPNLHVEGSLIYHLLTRSCGHLVTFQLHYYLATYRPDYDLHGKPILPY